MSEVWATDYTQGAHQPSQGKEKEMTKTYLDISLEVWQFFVEAHPDADMKAVVKHIAEETHKLTLQEVGQFLDDVMAVGASDEDWDNILEALKRGEMPE